MVSTMAFFAMNDAVVKLAGQQLELWQMITMRGVLASALIAALAWRFDALRLPRGRHARGRLNSRQAGGGGPNQEHRRNPTTMGLQVSDARSWWRIDMISAIAARVHQGFINGGRLH